MLIKILFLTLCLNALNVKSENQFKKCTDAKPDICGPNASCIDDENDLDYKRYDGAYCKCNPNFYGSPPKCSECIRDGHCPAHHYCSTNNKCIKGCRYGNCPKGMNCDDETRMCIDGCLEDHDCEDDQYCTKNLKCSQGCRDFGCPDGEICHPDTKVCTKGCQDDYECEDDEYCSNKLKCEKGCQIHNCEDGHICDEISRKCIEGCLGDYTCGTDEHCHEKEKKCRKVCETFSCGPNSKCKSKNHSKHCSCMDGYVLDASKKCTKSVTNQKFECSSCGKNSECKNYKTGKYCYCPATDNNQNPFVFCKEFEVKPTTYLPPQTTFRPGGENSISCATIACLSG